MWSNCDKCPIEHLSLGCHHHQGCALFNPAHRQPLPPLPKRSAGQRRSVCVRSGTGRFPKASRLNKHARRRAEKCVCVTITCVYPAVTLYMITTGCAYVSITSGTLTHTSSWVFFFFSRLHNLLMALLPRPFVCAYRLNVLLFSFIYSCFP